MKARVKLRAQLEASPQSRAQVASAIRSTHDLRPKKTAGTVDVRPRVLRPAFATQLTLSEDPVARRRVLLAQSGVGPSHSSHRTDALSST